MIKIVDVTAVVEGGVIVGYTGGAAGYYTPATPYASSIYPEINVARDEAIEGGAIEIERQPTPSITEAAPITPSPEAALGVTTQLKYGYDPTGRYDIRTWQAMKQREEAERLAALQPPAGATFVSAEEFKEQFPELYEPPSLISTTPVTPREPAPYTSAVPVGFDAQAAARERMALGVVEGGITEESRLHAEAVKEQREAISVLAEVKKEVRGKEVTREGAEYISSLETYISQLDKQKKDIERYNYQVRLYGKERVEAERKATKEKERAKIKLAEERTSQAKKEYLSERGLEVQERAEERMIRERKREAFELPSIELKDAKDILTIEKQPKVISLYEPFIRPLAEEMEKLEIKAIKTEFGKGVIDFEVKPYVARTLGLTAGAIETAIPSLLQYPIVSTGIKPDYFKMPAIAEAGILTPKIEFKPIFPAWQPLAKEELTPVERAYTIGVTLVTEAVLLRGLSAGVKKIIERQPVKLRALTEVEGPKAVTVIYKDGEPLTISAIKRLDVTKEGVIKTAAITEVIGKKELIPSAAVSKIVTEGSKKMTVGIHAIGKTKFGVAATEVGKIADVVAAKYIIVSEKGRVIAKVDELIRGVKPLDYVYDFGKVTGILPKVKTIPSMVRGGLIEATKVVQATRLKEVTKVSKVISTGVIGTEVAKKISAAVTPVKPPLLKPAIKPVSIILAPEPIPKAIMRLIEPVSKPIVELPALRIPERPVAKLLTTQITKPIIKPLMKVSPMVESIIKPITIPVVKSLVTSATKPITKPIIKQITKPIVKPIIKPMTMQIVKPIIKPIIKPITKPVIKPIVIPSPITPSPITPTRRIFPPIPIIEFPEIRKVKRRDSLVGPKFKGEYMPDIKSVVLQIFGKKPKAIEGRYTGLEERPLIKKKRKLLPDFSKIFRGDKAFKFKFKFPKGLL